MIHYRDAKPADAPAIVDFQIAMAQETEDFALDRATCTRGVDAVFRDRTLGRYFVGEEEGKVVASLMITPEWSDWRNGVVWWIQSVYVVPEFRRRGIYAGMYDHVQRIAHGDANVKGILNLSPATVRTPGNVKLRNLFFTSALDNLVYYLTN